MKQNKLFYALLLALFLPLAAKNNCNTNCKTSCKTSCVTKCNTGCDVNCKPCSTQSIDCINPIVDFIVVGAGTAGAAAAFGLSEEIDGERNSVVLLEAGSNYTDDPLVASNDPFRSIYNVAFGTKYSDTYSAHLGSEGNPINQALGYLYTEGRMWGGSSAHNVMLAVRGTPDIYDNWAAEAGNAQWSYDELLPIMRYMENYMPTGSVPDTSQRGVAGPLCISGNDYDIISSNTTIQMFAAAINAPLAPDYNVDNTAVVTSAPQWFMTAAPAGFFSPPTGERCSSATAFLPASVVDQDTGIGVAPRKLRVVSQATVSRVLFEGTTAVGVEYILNGDPEQVRRIYARKKIVLSAGATYNVGILQRSGVGDAALLGNLGIPVVADNANVGQNLQNHIGVYAAMSANNVNQDFTPVGFFPMFIGTTDDPTVRRIQINFNNTAFSFAEQSVLQVLGANPASALSINTAVLRPESRGTVKITDTDPLTTPEVNFNLYTDVGGNDIATAVETYSALEVLATAVGETMIYPTPAQYMAGDAALANAALAIPFAQYHALGTCAMGSDSNSSVVDGDLHVHGVSNLMCADCSIEPFMPTGNTAYQPFLIGLVAAKICGWEIPTP